MRAGSEGEWQRGGEGKGGGRRMRVLKPAKCGVRWCDVGGVGIRLVSVCRCVDVLVEP